MLKEWVNRSERGFQDVVNKFKRGLTSAGRREPQLGVYRPMRSSPIHEGVTRSMSSLNFYRGLPHRERNFPK